MAKDVYYPHCTTCGRTFETLDEANTCDHTSDQPNIVGVMSARLRELENDNLERYRAAKARLDDQAKQSGIAQQNEKPAAAKKQRKSFLGMYWE